MAPFRPEEVTLPVRFICKTAHLVAILTILFDVDKVVSHMEQIDPATSTNQSDLSTFDDRKSQVQGICYGAIACFGVEYITLFLGISMFFPPVMSLNILAHFTGTILVTLLYSDNWSFGAFAAFFAIFNAAPAMLEMLMLIFVTKFSFLKY